MKRIGIIKQGNKMSVGIVNRTSNKDMVSFRIDADTIKKLRAIANRKKATQTKVITELINLAYAGLYTSVGKGLNELYSLILKEGKKDTYKLKKATKS